MKDVVFKTLWPVLSKTVFPSALGALGAMAAVIYSEGFRAFCGL